MEPYNSYFLKKPLATVAKTSILLKLNHLFISLPFCKKITRIYIRKCTTKVKRQIVTKDKFRGGLDCFDIYNFVCSLTCSWINEKNSHFQTLNRYFFAINANSVVSGVLDFVESFIKMIINQIIVFRQDVFVMASSRTYIII